MKETMIAARRTHKRHPSASATRADIPIWQKGGHFYVALTQEKNLCFERMSEVALEVTRIVPSSETAELMDITAAAAFLGVCEEALRRWARAGRIPAGKLGRQWRFSRRQLLEFIEAGGTLCA